MADIIKASQSNIGVMNGGLNSTTNTSRHQATGGPSFQEALNKVVPGASAPAAALNALSGWVGKSTNVKFSNHAIERMRTRGISFDPKRMGQIEEAIDKVAAKGGKNALLLTDDSALIVSTNNRTVVTVMDKQSLKENVFTNIDSTMVL